MDIRKQLLLGNGLRMQAYYGSPHHRLIRSYEIGFFLL